MNGLLAFIRMRLWLLLHRREREIYQENWCGTWEATYGTPLTDDGVIEAD